MLEYTINNCDGFAILKLSSDGWEGMNKALTELIAKGEVGKVYIADLPLEEADQNALMEGVEDRIFDIRFVPRDESDKILDAALAAVKAANVKAVEAETPPAASPAPKAKKLSKKQRRRLRLAAAAAAPTPTTEVAPPATNPVELANELIEEMDMASPAKPMTIEEAAASIIETVEAAKAVKKEAEKKASLLHRGGAGLKDGAFAVGRAAKWFGRKAAAPAKVVATGAGLAAGALIVVAGVDAISGDDSTESDSD